MEINEIFKNILKTITDGKKLNYQESINDYSFDSVLKYLEKNNDVVKKNKIISDKDILRKLPESFDYTNINTPIELKSLWPINILGEYDL